MKINTWNYYNHAMLPNCAPHEEPDLELIKNNKIWKQKNSGCVLMARWTTNYDCGYVTDWWYCIKDTTYDIQSLKAKRRYEINKGRKNFSIRIINPRDYAEELYEIEKAAYRSWPEKYRPKVDHDSFVQNVYDWNFYRVYAGFSNQTNKICAYAILTKSNEKCIGFSSLRVNPEHEKDGINAAMVDGILVNQEDIIIQGGYICDGARSISHETAFQDYLEKYFGFRKAYCHLHIKYRFPLSLFIYFLMPFRRKLEKYDQNKLIHNVNAILKMQEYVEHS